jgi:DNA topoisomerase-1
MLTNKFTQMLDKAKGRHILTVNGKDAPAHIKALRIPPAWKDVMIDPTSTKLIATGKDAAGRKTSLYHPDWVALSKTDKFIRVRALISEHKDIRTQIESDINDPTRLRDREAAIVAYLILETGIRPGSTTDTRAQVQAFGATTLQLRHAKPCARGIRLRFVGKKGVRQSVLVTNPYLVRLIKARRRDGQFGSPSRPIFLAHCNAVNQYIGKLGSGDYTAKDFRTALGTRLARELLGTRKKMPRSKSKRKALCNNALDKIAHTLGNTRAMARKAYVDPTILERYES